mmetsp:Transcript_1691/g.2800  ORF Transcript_1691/g.2800 Transcript_1691/m.2800 type:complete len:281 (-) Transcript_1691:3117-3959(-)
MARPPLTTFLLDTRVMPRPPPKLPLPMLPTSPLLLPPSSMPSTSTFALRPSSMASSRTTSFVSWQRTTLLPLRASLTSTAPTASLTRATSSSLACSVRSRPSPIVSASPLFLRICLPLLISFPTLRDASMARSPSLPIPSSARPRSLLSRFALPTFASSFLIPRLILLPLPRAPLSLPELTFLPLSSLMRMPRSVPQLPRPTSAVSTVPTVSLTSVLPMLMVLLSALGRSASPMFLRIRALSGTEFSVLSPTEAPLSLHFPRSLMTSAESSIRMPRLTLL